MTNLGSSNGIILPCFYTWWVNMGQSWWITRAKEIAQKNMKKTCENIYNIIETRQQYVARKTPPSINLRANWLFPSFFWTISMNCGASWRSCQIHGKPYSLDLAMIML